MIHDTVLTNLIQSAFRAEDGDVPIIPTTSTRHPAVSTAAIIHKHFSGSAAETGQSVMLNRKPIMLQKQEPRTRLLFQGERSAIKPIARDSSTCSAENEQRRFGKSP